LGFFVALGVAGNFGTRNFALGVAGNFGTLEIGHAYRPASICRYQLLYWEGESLDSASIS
jgi:hypothetical protein